MLKYAQLDGVHECRMFVFFSTHRGQKTAYTHAHTHTVGYPPTSFINMRPNGHCFLVPWEIHINQSECTKSDLSHKIIITVLPSVLNDEDSVFISFEKLASSSLLYFHLEAARAIRTTVFFYFCIIMLAQLPLSILAITSTRRVAIASNICRAFTSYA